MKKKLSRIFLVILALSMALSLTACGKRALEDAINNDKDVQASIEEIKNSAAEQDITVDIYAEGDYLFYDYILPLSVTEDELELVLPQIEDMADVLKAALKDLANDIKGKVSNDTVKIVVSFYDEAKTELLTTTIEADA